MEEKKLAEVGIFDPKGASLLWKKCRERRADGQFSNSDNMALVGVLSTQLLHRSMVEQIPWAPDVQFFRTEVDFCEEQDPVKRVRHA
jgi:asparagine synthase (glutamine-hydrolysing)